MYLNKEILQKKSSVYNQERVIMARVWYLKEAQSLLAWHYYIAKNIEKNPNACKNVTHFAAPKFKLHNQ